MRVYMRVMLADSTLCCARLICYGIAYVSAIVAGAASDEAGDDMATERHTRVIIERR